MIIGIRREDKNKWESRVPFTPEQVAQITKEEGVKFIVQPSPDRSYPDEEYVQAGAELTEDLAAADLVMTIKEIPPELFVKDKAYAFFSHTIKGQQGNMPMLKRMMELGCTLIDYEKITNAGGYRIVHFGHFAGLAGMIDSLKALGNRMEQEGVKTPFSKLQQAYEYESLEAAEAAVSQVGKLILEEGLPTCLQPLVVGVGGYGNTSMGAQQILGLLPVEEVTPEALLKDEIPGDQAKTVYKVVFREEDSLAPASGGDFELADFYLNPEDYVSRFADYLPHLSVLMNCIFWEPGQPRLVTKDDVKTLYKEGTPKLRILGDISCDLNGAIEVTEKATEPDNPAYVWDVATKKPVDGYAGNGPVVVAVDNLPCELPREASTAFGQALYKLIPEVAKADLSKPLAEMGLPAEVQRAVILDHGKLTHPFAYMSKYL